MHGYKSTMKYKTVIHLGPVLTGWQAKGHNWPTKNLSSLNIVIHLGPILTGWQAKSHNWPTTELSPFKLFIHTFRSLCFCLQEREVISESVTVAFSFLFGCMPACMVS